jgi:hypothetical protein
MKARKPAPRISKGGEHLHPESSAVGIAVQIVAGPADSSFWLLLELVVPCRTSGGRKP